MCSFPIQNFIHKKVKNSIAIFSLPLLLYTQNLVLRFKLSTKSCALTENCAQNPEFCTVLSTIFTQLFLQKYDDCMKRGKGIFSGGIKYLGGTIEAYGNTNTSDSLYAIKDAVYDRKVISREQLLSALTNNFEGFERERTLLLNIPKYGNDHKEIDELAVSVHQPSNED